MISTSGHGELTVKNGTSEDAVVRLSDAGTDQIVRCFFVRAHTSAHVAHIPQGTYRLAFTSGLNWVESEDTFSWHPSYSEFERTFAYSEEQDSEGVHYHSISVTLHPVPSGNCENESNIARRVLERPPTRCPATPLRAGAGHRPDSHPRRPSSKTCLRSSLVPVIHSGQHRDSASSAC